MSRGPVKPKKHLGQHFLTNKAVSARIAEAVKLHGHDGRVLEIGPGTGALTEFLLAREDLTVAVIEVDTVPGMTPSTVLFHQALAMDPPMEPADFLAHAVSLALDRRDQSQQDGGGSGSRG